MRLADIVEKLEETQVEIAHIENVISQHPDMPASAFATLRGFHKRQQQLEAAFANTASEQFIDVCSYRLFNENEAAPPQLPALANALLRFQSFYTVAYSALKKPKKTSHVGVEDIVATTFSYGYSFSGSVGFVLTLPNEQLLLDETDLDKAIKVVFEMAQATSSDQIAEFAKKYGAGPIREMYKWVDSLVQGGLGADIDWRREDIVRAKLFRQTPDLKNLMLAIQETSDEVRKTHRIAGELVGIDVARRTFRMKFTDTSEVRGRIADSIGVVEVPQRYTAEIETTTKINYATDQEEVSHFLLALTRPSS